MLTRTTVALGRGPALGSGISYGANRPDITVIVPWSPEFGAAYQQFVGSSFGSPMGGMPMGGLPGTPFGGGMPMGGMGSLPMGGMPMGGMPMGGMPMGGMPMGGMPMGGMPMGGFGGSPMGGGGMPLNVGGNQVQGVPIGFGVTTGL